MVPIERQSALRQLRGSERSEAANLRLKAVVFVDGADLPHRSIRCANVIDASNERAMK